MSDYGNPDDPHDFDFIYPISPLHNIPDRVLPPFILLTADRVYLSPYAYHVRDPNFPTDDDRVVPMHSFKHAATLQHMHPNNPHPLLLRVDKKAGHGAGKSVEKRYRCFPTHMLPWRTYLSYVRVFFRIQEAADKWGFVAQSMGLVWKDKLNRL